MMFLAGLSGAPLALAQHEGHQMPGQGVGQTQPDPRVRASLSEIERLNLVIENVRQANDPAKMRAAIDELQNSLATIRANLLAVSSAGTSEQVPMAPGPPGAMDQSHMNMPGMSPPPKSPPASEAKPSSETKMGHPHRDMPGMSPATKKSETKSGSSSKANVGQAPAPGNMKDPVCGMEVETKSAEKATYQGKIYYFCSKADKEKFLADPGKYLKR
jgi:YHS domain-containing protein